MTHAWHFPFEAAADPSAAGGEPEGKASPQASADPPAPLPTPEAPVPIEAAKASAAEWEKQLAPEAPAEASQTLVPAGESPTVIAEQYGHSGEWRAVCVANFDTFAAELDLAKPPTEDAAISVVLAYWAPPTRLVKVPPEWIA